MEYTYDDGGREAAGYKGDAGDCVTRAIAIATDRDYEEVRQELMQRNADFRSKSRCRKAKRMKSNSARNGVHKEVWKQYLEDYGWRWTPTMKIGQGTTVHLDERELPPGRLICSCRKHLVAVLDGVLHDTHDFAAETYWSETVGDVTTHSIYRRTVTMDTTR
jgi:hypothetical protein